MDKDLAKQKIKELVEKYEQVLKSGKLKGYTEQETKNGFIEPLFNILGWDTTDKNEVSLEEQISGDRADYGFYLNGRPKFYVEAKALKADLHNPIFAEQAIRYSWNKGVPWAVLTDFENIKVFNSEVISESLSSKLLFDIPYSEFLKRFEEQIWLLSKESFEQNLIDKYATKFGKMKQRVPVGEKLYKDLNECREILTKKLSASNPDVKDDYLDEGIQKLLDRLIFIKVAEDRGIEDKTLIPLLRQQKGKETLYESMIEKFRELDGIYNSNLFTPHNFENWSDDFGATKEVINKLQGVAGYYEYDFKAMPADILGGVYENYLGHRLQKSKKGLNVDKDAKKRKEQGIYYTPSFIVDYIVKNALKPVLDKCQSINDLKKIKVLDPACGSGSFLIKALEVINDKYKEFGNIGNEYTKIMILQENLYGVDLDEQAVEITRLNLTLGALETRMKIPLLKNIKNGNSLISGADEELQKYFGKNFRDKKPFNWQEQFPEVFAQGGFDVIIGNPPWGADIDDSLQFFAEKYPNSTKEKKDVYKMFIEKSISILNSGGMLGFITPNSFLYQPSYEDVKNLINQYSNFVINLGDKIFKNVTVPYCILILSKQKSSNNTFIDFVNEEKTSLATKLLSLNLKDEKNKGEKKKLIIKKTALSFGDVFMLKDAGIQYHRSGIGLSNKGGSDLYERIFCRDVENKFKESKKTYYGKLMQRYYISNETDELFNLNYKDVINKNESVSFSRDAFTQNPKILWRQTAPTIFATLDEEKRWFRNTIQCGWVKDEYKNDVNIFYSLSIFNSKYINYVYRQKVLEAGRVFPQVKIKYLQNLPFIIGTTEQQKSLADKAKRMIKFYKELQETPENSNKWESIKSEIEKTDKKIDEEVYKLYRLTEEEIRIVENNK